MSLEREERDRWIEAQEGGDLRAAAVRKLLSRANDVASPIQGAEGVDSSPRITVTHEGMTPSLYTPADYKRAMERVIAFRSDPSHVTVGSGRGLRVYPSYSWKLRFLEPNERRDLRRSRGVRFNPY